VEALTGLRGVAAVFVFLFHYLHFNPQVNLVDFVPIVGKVLQFPFDFGFMGVDLFFVLSGFLLSLPFAAAALGSQESPGLKRYFKRRVLRVFPAYYAQFAVILVVGSWFAAWKPLNAGSLVAHLFMFFNIGPDPVRPMVGVWWTLPVEFSFYLALPIIAIMMRPRRWLLLLLALGASVAYRFWAAGHFESGNPLMLAANHLPGSLPEFLLGAGAAFLIQWRAQQGAPPRPPWLLDATLIVSMILTAIWFLLIVGPNGDAYWTGHWSMIMAPTVLGLLLGALVWAVYGGSRLGRLLFANRGVHFLGLVSYSLYLWHFVVMQQLIRVFGEVYSQMPQVPKFMLTTLAVLFIAWLSYWFIERPFFRQRAFVPKDSDVKT